MPTPLGRGIDGSIVAQPASCPYESGWPFGTEGEALSLRHIASNDHELTLNVRPVMGNVSVPLV